MKEQCATGKRATISLEKPAPAENLLDIPEEGKKRPQPFSELGIGRETAAPMFGEWKYPSL
ncbi:hypothetical protein HMPREF3038_03020 [Akkermansia sp. KLE1797]|nr:hypothetical protein HMPREF3038_03020 [Akkermansia sp. KLE1797]KXU53758.1 hypothetical protein HMPREF3039_02094 [Akkermansia sp. KLE1798]KZA03531.1 hypothetical protein HMPREF1326_02832 [Akkermansia sp. KLE1605]